MVARLFNNAIHQLFTLSRRTWGKFERLPFIKLLVDELMLLLGASCAVLPSWSDDLTWLVDSVAGMTSSLLRCLVPSSSATTTRTCGGVWFLPLPSLSGGGEERRGGGGERDDCGLWSSPHGVLWRTKSHYQSIQSLSSITKLKSRGSITSTSTWSCNTYTNYMISLDIKTINLFLTCMLTITCYVAAWFV